MTTRPLSTTPILLYHSISDAADRRDLPFTVSPATFARHVAMIASSGAEVVTISELVAGRRKVSPPERPVVAVTCDDGYADTGDVFAETLLAAGLAATVYVSTGTIDETVRSKRMISWAQVRDLAAAGFEVGSHGHHHLQLDTTRPRRVTSELRQSQELLGNHLGAAPATFAYPHGYYTPKVAELVRRTGFESACAVKNALSHPGDDLFGLSRVTVTRDLSPERLAAVLRGEGTVVSRQRRLATRAWRAARYLDALTMLEVLPR